jgi:membrane-bound metal-dependent hydrolase YbcI (DUF457 family)
LSYFAGIPVPRPLSAAAWTALAYLAAGLLSHHRGITHSLLALGITGAALLASGTGLHGAAPWLGTATHIAADALTPEGVRLLWPADRRIGVALVRTGSGLDLLAGAASALLVVAMLGWR